LRVIRDHALNEVEIAGTGHHPTFCARDLKRIAMENIVRGAYQLCAIAMCHQHGLATFQCEPQLL
jgi:hypothetical protein